MPRLNIRCDEVPVRSYELKAGVNRLGRSPKNDLQLDHPTVSTHHCEIILGNGDIIVRDCGSTNGTYIDSEQISEQVLQEGQSLHVGEVEMALESVQVNIAIPQFEISQEPRPVILPDGSPSCPNHHDLRATFRCSHCKQLMCDDCVHRLKRAGGKLLLLCPLCSNQCEPMSAPKRKRSFLGFLEKTLKMATKPGSKERSR